MPLLPVCPCPFETGWQTREETFLIILPVPAFLLSHGRGSAWGHSDCPSPSRDLPFDFWQVKDVVGAIYQCLQLGSSSYWTRKVVLRALGFLLPSHMEEILRSCLSFSIPVNR